MGSFVKLRFSEYKFMIFRENGVLKIYSLYYNLFPL